MKWSVPKMWESGTAFIIGGGPSLEGMDWDPFHDHRIIGCNDAYLLGPWVDVCCFGDVEWHRAHDYKWVHLPEEVRIPDCVAKHNGTKFAGLRQYSGIKVTNCHSQFDESRRDVLQLNRYERGLSDDPAWLGWNCNTGAAAINLALLFGCKRVVLLGFDMAARPIADEREREEERIIHERVHDGSERQMLQQRIDWSRQNGHGDPRDFKANWHPNIKNHCNPSHYDKFIDNFKFVERDLPKKFPEAEILNATPGSRLETFPMVSLEEVLNEG